MGLGKRLLLLAACLAVFNLVLWGLPKLAPEAPERYEGVSLPAPPSGPVSLTIPLPPEFPSMDRPPPKIKVPDGQPQPIETKFGLTYDIPADWRNFSTGIVGWTTGGESVTYGAVGDFGYNHCPETDGSTLAETGMTGRNGMDVDAAALGVAKDAEIIFGDSDAGAPPVLAYSEPVRFDIEGEPAVRYTVRAEGLHRSHECDPPGSTFDVVATSGFATASVAVFMIRLDQGGDSSLDHSVTDSIISTIRRSEHKAGA